MDDAFRCGFIALIGRPNVGKSTLLNRLVGQKISITSSKPQTTRHRVLGIDTHSNVQYIYVDTPGIHGRKTNAMNRIMNREAKNAIADVDVILFVIESGKWRREDDDILTLLIELRKPVVAVLNKVDTLADKETLLPALTELSKKMEFSEIVPVSAKKGTNISELQVALKKYLPVSIPFFPEEQVTDRSTRFLSSEVIREKLMRSLGKEIPYQVTVGVEHFEETERTIKISAIIWV